MTDRHRASMLKVDFEVTTSVIHFLLFSLRKTVVQGNIAKWYFHIPHAVTFFYNVWQGLLCLWHIQLTVIMHWWSVHVNRVSPSKTLKNEKAHKFYCRGSVVPNNAAAHHRPTYPWHALFAVVRAGCLCVTVRRECREKTHDIVLFSGEGKMQGVTLIIHRMLTPSSSECGDVQHTCVCCVGPWLCIMEN